MSKAKWQNIAGSRVKLNGKTLQVLKNSLASVVSFLAMTRAIKERFSMLKILHSEKAPKVKRDYKM